MASNDPLHNTTLKKILTDLETWYGFEGLSKRINIKCFNIDPSINSSLKFLRKTPWAREKVESLYLMALSHKVRKGKVEEPAPLEL